MLTGHEIREKFLSYFESKNHARIASSLLVPLNDPTLYFTNAGMVPFKDVFTGIEKRATSRATSSQKCLRVSGKHNDLENVGRTPRHHTFFEMLGNFSFGDYFKKEAIVFAWEFLTEIVAMNPDALWVTVFREDDEAEKLWIKEVGFPKKKIIRCDEKDNFWSMGEVGPCGPCSEIHVDLSLLHGKGRSPGNPITHDADFMEIWNLVFMEYDRDSKGVMTPLPKPSIDTGMGLERLTAVLQKKPSNYDTDLFQPLIQAISKRTKKIYGGKNEEDVSLRVIADHIRAATFLINDGVLPSNEGRGYVLRRIMRRAIRHGRLLGMREPFFYDIVDPLVMEMKLPFPDLEKNKNYITKIIRSEEERFLETLENGLAMMDQEICQLAKSKKKILDGKVAFKLYDTFGFPVDLTQLIAEENGLYVDMKGFEESMEGQKTRARAAWKGSGEEKINHLYHQLAEQKKTTQFLGYDMLECKAKITALIKDGECVEKIIEGEGAQVFVDQTPFYGESGGQVGDVGRMGSKKGTLHVQDTQKPLEGIFSHRVVVEKGEMSVGDEVQLSVDPVLRRATMLNHTGTHILHAVLREILGDHIKQAGSLVDADHLRFDFTHFEGLNAEILEKIETRVNQIIQASYPVSKEEMSLESAKKKGALAFFGDKYGDRVRVVSVGGVSLEFCGGTHLNNSGEIGLLKILSETSVASGVRRIEAITGMKALQYIRELENREKEMAGLLRTPPGEMVSKVAFLQKRIKDLEKEVALSKTQRATGGGGADLLSTVKTVRGVRLLTLETDLEDPRALRDFSDQIKSRLGSGVIVLGAKVDGGVSLIVSVSKDLTEKYHAGNLIKELAPLVGGKGGGQAHMAQAGGSEPSNLIKVFQKIEELL